MWLRVIDSSGNWDEIRYRIHVLGPRTEEIVRKGSTKANKSIASSQSEKSDTKSSTKKKKKKSKKIEFFNPPTLILQNPDKITYRNDVFSCRTTSKTCSINLSLSGVTKGIVYTWQYSNGDQVVSKNPRSRSLTPGVHNIHLIASYEE
jgi:hypothetical protein